MNDKEILNSLKSSINEAPIDILDNIKNEKIVKMTEHDDITRQESKKMFLKPMMAVASIAALFLIFINLQIQYKKPDSQIYLDINPSFQITTNRRDKVIGLRSLNEDAEELLEDIDYKNRDVYLVTEEIIDSLLDHSYIDKADEIMLLSVYNQDGEKRNKQANELNKRIHQKLDAIDKNPIILTQPLEKSNTVEEYAKKYKISVGKMTFIRNLIILNPNLKTEDLIDISLSELIEISQKYELDIDKIINSKDVDRITKPSKPITIDEDPKDDDQDDNDD
ncbi:MAG: hypothetical protein GX370_05110 [Clostridia bacterium]|nr:hypothetical protein [Clostridia bacterium]